MSQLVFEIVRLSPYLVYGLRASELLVLNVNHWNGKRLTVNPSKGQKNISEVPLSREAKQHLEAYLQWRRQEDEMFNLLPDSLMFLCQDPKHRGERLGYKGLYKMVKKLGVMLQAACCLQLAFLDDRIQHEFGTSISHKGVDLLYGKELMNTIMSRR